MMKNALYICVCLTAMLLMAAGCSDSGDSKPGETPECYTDDDCPIGTRCIDIYCEPLDQIPCLRDEDCPYGLSCENQVCTSDNPIPCTTTNDCPRNMSCVFGQCYPDNISDGDIPDGDTDTDTVQPGGICSPCQDDPDCEGDFNYCIPDESGETFCGKMCRNSVDCPSEYICKNFVFGNQCFPVDGFCEESCIDTGCPANEACDTTTGQCKPITSGSQGFCEPCNSDADCRDNGACIPDITGVTFCGIDCSNDQPCTEVNTYCKRVSDTVRQCWPLNNRCEAVPPTGLCDDVSCPQRMLCDETSGQCVYQGNHCHLTGCPDGYACSETTGQCESPPTHCAVVGCDPGFWCNPDTGICEVASDGDVDTSGYCDPCTGQEDCGPGAACIENSETFDAFCAPPCDSHADCPSGSACRADMGWNTCIPNAMTCRPSATGGGCTMGEDCALGVCIQEFAAPNVVWPRGYCTAICNPSDPFNSCGSDGYCFQIEYNYGAVENLCMRLCSLGNSSSCRQNYVCYDVGFGNGQGLCITSLYPF